MNDPSMLSKGNVNSGYAYQTLDRSPLDPAKTYYYQLVMVDKDGKKALSKVVAITTAPEFTFKLYPNPVSESSHLSIMLTSEDMNVENENVSVEIIDMSRKATYSQQVSLQNNMGQLDLVDFSDNLKAGIYLVIIKSDYKTYQERLVIR
ncbi:MAG: T9SS type A sorting domain-containing protein [Cytophagaceae bacterium]|nr:T9SS type A sorting domain-containing protein [Cytophagaceae bacterium]